jgi:hypothetical protein
MTLENQSMDSARFDSLTRTLIAAGSRRQALAALVGSLGLLGWHGTENAAAHNPLKTCKKKSGQQKKKCLKKAKQHNATHTAALPPAGPVTTADAACHFPPGAGHGGARVAQTFRALRSGHLTSASVLLVENLDGASFDLEIWSVNAANVPSTVLAGTTIANVPATEFWEPRRPLSGTFSAPPAVVAGLRYALVVTGPMSQFDSLFSLQVGGDASCTDGHLFHDPEADGTFEARQMTDLDFATFVTA